MASSKPIVLRRYQRRIIDASAGKNTLVVLPTGAGKTVIAGEIIMTAGVPAVFLVPTVLLVSQQQKALSTWTGMNVQPFCGALALPREFDILVSTPAAFERAQLKPGNLHLQWEALHTVVFDEVHHVLKNHPFRKLALSLRASDARPYVLGLTASYTYAVDAAQVHRKLGALCRELRVTSLQTAGDAELRASGYHALGSRCERPSAARAVNDVAPPGVVPRVARKPHLMQQTFMDRVAARTATPFALALAAAVRAMEADAQRRERTFNAPLAAGRGMKLWGAEAHRHAGGAARAGGGPAAGLFAQLEQWYEALRLLIVSWEESDFLAVLLLRMFACDAPDARRVWAPRTRAIIDAFWDAAPTQFARLDALRATLLEKYAEREQFRGLLFVEQRITTHVLEYYIASDPELAERLSTACIYAASTPATPSYRVTKTQAAERLAAFAIGRVNLLIATIVAEEGMDVPAANCVIRFDSMHHAVSLVQGRGRARQADSSFVVLSERADRPATVLEATERTQRELLQKFKISEATDADDEKERVAQKNRERGATAALYASDLNVQNALLHLNLFCTKTKVVAQVAQSGKKSDFETHICYRSVLRRVTGRGVGTDKKAAKREAALQTMRLLRKDFEENP